MASTYQSTQETNRTASPVTPASTTEANGRVRHQFFKYTTSSSAGPSATETIDLCTIPNGARIIGGNVYFEAMGGSGAIQIGDGTTAGKYLGTTSVASAGSAGFANTVALYQGQLLTADTTIVATVTTGAWTTSKILQGYVLWVID